MADTKWSQFPSATPGNSDEVVGLHSGDNARFTIANIVAAVRNGLANIFVPKTDVGAAGGVASLDNTGKVPTSQLPSSTGPEPATATPLMDGTGAVGASTKYAREDHEHPADTNKQDKITASGILKGDGQGGVSAATAGTDFQAPLTAGMDYATPAQLEGKANQAQLAAVESGNTATSNHPENSTFCLNGYFCKAITAIAVGDSFVEGQNYKKTTVADSKESVWTFIAETTGATGISLPTPWKELLAEVYYDNIHWPVHIVRETLRGSNNYYRHGYYYNSTYNGGCSVSVGNTQAVLQSCYTRQTDRTTDTIVRYYWR